MTKLAVIVGPTASGKTALSVDVAERLNAEIVSADSVQIYEKLNIGSAKPTKDEMRGIRHHLVDCVKIDAAMSAAAYKAMAKSAVEDISARGKLAMAVGGTGLYVNALISPLDFTEAQSSQALRDEWYEREQRESGCAHAKLSEIDPKTAARLHPNDKKRVIRAIEVYELTGKPMSEQNSEFRKQESPYRLSMIGLTMPRDILYARIEERVDKMVQQGLVDEVRSLLNDGADANMPSMQGLGYKEIVAYLKGECTLQDAIDTVKRDTRHFAKRQLTWFRRDERIHWYDVCEFTGGELGDTIASRIREDLNI